MKNGLPAFLHSAYVVIHALAVSVPFFLNGGRRSILILSIHLRLGVPSGLFPSGFRSRNLYAVLFSAIRDTRPAHLIPFFIIQIILDEEYKLRSFLYALLITLPSIFSNILSTFFSNTSVYVRD
jgi:hypothetical protein